MELTPLQHAEIAENTVGSFPQGSLTIGYLKVAINAVGHTVSFYAKDDSPSSRP